MTTLVNLGALDEASVKHDPFDYVMTSEAMSAEDAARIIADYPEVPTAGNYRPDEVTYGPAFGALVTELQSQEFADNFPA